MQKNDAEEIAEKLWSTTPSDLSDTRQAAFKRIQEYADTCTANYFKNYLGSLEQTCEMMEKYDPMLNFYRLSFDKVLNEVQTTTVEKGTSVIWLLYNMGYIVKTPSGCFGIDISHRYAERFAPYLDFLCVTHNHSDHYDDNLIQAMLESNKPVLSNYLKPSENYKFTSKTPTAYTIGSFKVTTNITDHNTSLTNFVTTYQINCGQDGGNLVLMHVGDSNYKASQYAIAEHVNVFIPRYAPNALSENNVLGSVVTPDYVLLSHIMELAHAGVEESRWTIELGLERASQLNCANSLVPFWGEKFIWKNNTFN
nr:MBL fold metallo-hydrolase [Dysgonomonas sp. Marseille-P4677]